MIVNTATPHVDLAEIALGATLARWPESASGRSPGRATSIPDE
jgi:hypothetical protein